MAASGLLGGDAKQVMTFTTTLGPDAFKVLGAKGREELGRMPEFSVDLVGETTLLGNPKDVDLQALLGTVATLKMEVNEDPRYFNFYIVHMERGGRHGRYESYTATLRPGLWFLTRTRNSRVFQGKTVKQIVTEVLTEYTLENDWRLLSEASHQKLDYCVQYQETDFDFISRLMEESGFYYFFEHTESTHTMVVLDAIVKHKKKNLLADTITWANALRTGSSAIQWTDHEESRSVKAVVWDYNYLATATDIKAEKAGTRPPAKLGSNEIYEYPGRVVQNGATEEPQHSGNAAARRATVAIEEANSLRSVSRARTNTRDLFVGSTFRLERHPRLLNNVNYLCVRAVYKLEFGEHEAIEDLAAIKRPRDGFVCDFEATPIGAGNFRPERTTPKPLIQGPQTALVVGASGNEIETDKHGRVKIQFPWDRKGLKDMNSSCWVRVATPWASKNFGMISLPRVGDEVVVSFIGGDPDQPIITGSVYNDVNPPAYELPKLATVSGIKTRSSKSGTKDTANELRFEDKKDSEYVWFQAQKDHFHIVKKNVFEMIGENETIKVKLTRKDVVGENFFQDIGKDVMQQVGKDLHQTVAGDVFLNGAATYQIKLAKDYSAAVGGDYGLKITGKTAVKSTGDVLITSDSGGVHLKATSGVVIECAAGITLKCGGSLVSLTSAGVDIVGAMVKVNSGGGGSSATAASPTEAAEAKKEESTTPGKATDYDKQFDDPIVPPTAGPAVPTPPEPPDPGAVAAAAAAAAAAAEDALAVAAATAAAALDAVATAALIGSAVGQTAAAVAEGVVAAVAPPPPEPPGGA
jgi:type VI secretion system secreted protein VgrG